MSVVRSWKQDQEREMLGDLLGQWRGSTWDLWAVGDIRLPKQDTSPLCDLPVFVRRGSQASLLPGLPIRLMPWFGGHVGKDGPP